MTRNGHRHRVTTNSTLTWISEGGTVPLGIDESTCKPIFATTEYKARGWLERAITDINERFDSTELADYEPITFVGRIHEGFHESLIQAQDIKIQLYPHQYANVDKKREYWAFKGRVIWTGGVAIDVRSYQFKHKFGEPINLVGYIRRGWTG